MANIRTFRQKTKDGKEITRYMLDYVDRSGKRRRLRLPKGTTRKDAKLAKLEAELFKELPRRERFRPLMTLEEAHDLYLVITSFDQSDEHKRLILQSQRQLLEMFGNIRMIEFTLLDGTRFQQHLQEKNNLAPSTVRTYCHYAKLFFDWARRNGQIDFNIFDNVRLKRRKPSTAFLTEKELGMVYDEIMNTARQEKRLELQCLCLLLNQCGCRISEVLNTPLNNYDFDNNFIQLAPVKKKLRNVIVHPDTMKLLSQLKSQNADKKVMFRHCSRWYGKQFKAIFQKLGIQYGKKPLHLFRHTFCTLAIQNGANKEDIAMFVGHCDSRVTEQNYIHVVPVVDSSASDFGRRLASSLLNRSPDDKMSNAS